MQSVPITTKVVCSNPVQGEVYSIQHSPVTQVSSTNKTDHNDIAEILMKVAFNTINQPTTNDKPLQFGYPEVPLNTASMNIN